MKTKTTAPRFPSKIAQKIYLKRAGVASQIYAKYADSGTVPTNLISGGGIKPLTNQQQQPATQPKPLETPKTPETPQQPTQPAAPAIEPIPANVPAPPVVPPPQSGLPPATPMVAPAAPAPPQAPAASVSPNQAQPGTVSESGQITGQPAGQQPGESAGNPANPQQPGGQSSGQPSGQMQVDPARFAQDLQQMPREQAVPKAKEYVQAELAKPENKQVMVGLEDIKSGDPARANTPAAHAYKTAMQKAPEGLIREEYERLLAATPNATPRQQGSMMQQAISTGMARFQEMPWPAQLMMGLGLGAGLIGMFSSLFGEGGAESGLLGLLGIGAAGLIGANYGVFGNDARKMVGQGALGLGRMMGMKIPDAKAFTPEGIEQAKADATTSVMEALDGNAKKKIPAGGWQGGIKKIEELRSPLDQLANTAETYGRDFAITTLMGAMNTNDPSVAQQKFDMLMKQRQEMMDPQYLYNQAHAAALQKVPSWVPEAARPAAATGGLFATYGSYPEAKK